MKTKILTMDKTKEEEYYDQDLIFTYNSNLLTFFKNYRELKSIFKSYSERMVDATSEPISIFLQLGSGYGTDADEVEEEENWA